MNTKLKSFFFYSFVLLLTAECIEYLSSPSRLNFNATILVGILKFTSLALVLYSASKMNWMKDLPRTAVLVFKLMIAWNIFIIFHGIISADDYWDWKFIILNNIPSLLMPYMILVGAYFYDNVKLVKFLLFRLFPFSLVLIPLSTVSIGMELYSRMVTGIVLFILLSIYMDRKWRLFIYFVAIMSILIALGYRANIIRIIFAGVLVIIYYTRALYTVRLFKIVSILFFIFPFVFAILGATDTFNIFKPFDSNENNFVVSNQGTDEDLAADTRTFLYVEVLTSVSQHNRIIFGEGAAGKYVSAWFQDIDRYGAEVGLLNMILYGGVISVILYLWLLVLSSHYAISHSNNFLSKMLGLFIAFRWMLLFVEDITVYDMNFYFLWIVIGLAMSKRLRSLSDQEIRNYFAFLLGNIRYKRIQHTE